MRSPRASASELPTRAHGAAAKPGPSSGRFAHGRRSVPATITMGRSSRPPSSGRRSHPGRRYVRGTDQRATAFGTTRLGRVLWTALGALCVALGGIGVVVPGLPTTVFFIIAAACFSRSSPGLEQWVLGLPRVGPLVRDHRAGLGMSWRAKCWAVGSIVVFGGVGACTVASTTARIAIVTAMAGGIAYLVRRVPTRAPDAEAG
jgi:uncharacterized membrane protein YbaN (DUF454 family)